MTGLRFFGKSHPRCLHFAELFTFPLFNWIQVKRNYKWKCWNIYQLALSTHLFKVSTAELYYGHSGKLPQRAHLQSAVLHLIQVWHDNQQVRTGFHWKETSPWYVDTYTGGVGMDGNSQLTSTNNRVLQYSTSLTWIIKKMTDRTTDRNRSIHQSINQPTNQPIKWLEDLLINW